MRDAMPDRGASILQALAGLRQRTVAGCRRRAGKEICPREVVTEVSRVARILCIMLMGFAAACQQPRSAAELASEAQAEAALGRYDLAIASMEKAIQQDPADPELRLSMARIYLASGRGDLAEATIGQAVERGLPPVRALGLKARALLLQGQFYEVLAMTVPDPVQPLTDLELRFLQAKALLAVSNPAQSDVEITRAFLRLVPLSRQFRDAPVAAEIATEFERLREEWPDVERAWQHLDCESRPVATFTWAPVAREGARVLRVGADRELKTPAAAAAVARDGDIVEIDPGDYAGGVALWPQNRLIVRGAGARPAITASGRTVRNRDVWLFTGDDIIVENVALSGARSMYENGAGIRHTGRNLQLRNVFLHDNENGVLTGNANPDSEILIEYSELANNGDAKGYAHNAYIGRSAKLTFRFNYTHEASGGHLLKSRARENIVAYNRMTDEEDGASSYIIDIPEGGSATIIGNAIQQGYQTLNHGMISYAGEAMPHAQNELNVVNNTVYNREYDGVFVRNHAGIKVRLINNLLAGAEVTSALGPSQSWSTLSHPEHGLANWQENDFRLTPGAHAIDAGSDIDPAPIAEYVHPARGRERLQVWRRDVGAYERCGL